MGDGISRKTKPLPRFELGTSAWLMPHGLPRQCTTAMLQGLKIFEWDLTRGALFKIICSLAILKSSLHSGSARAQPFISVFVNRRSPAGLKIIPTRKLVGDYRTCLRSARQAPPLSVSFLKMWRVAVWRNPNENVRMHIWTDGSDCTDPSFQYSLLPRMLRSSPQSFIN